MNDNSGSIDDPQKPAGAKPLKRTLDEMDNRLEFGDLPFRTNFRKFSADKIDDYRPRQIAAAKRIEDFVYSRNQLLNGVQIALDAFGVAFHFTHASLELA